jgi:hypothetical protein
LTTLLQTLDSFTSSGLVSPTPLQQLLATPATSTTTMSYTAQDATSSIPTDVINELSNVNTSAIDVRSAMSTDPTTQVNPDDLIAPIHTAIARTSSSAWRDIPGGVSASVGETHDQLLSLLRQVTVETSPQSISLSSSTSPIPVYISSKLPVSITVRINLDNNTGLRPDPIPDQTIAANSAFQRYLSAEALRAGRFSVDVSLSTPGGTQLGNGATLELTSNQYGLVTIIVTIAAAGALLLLSGRRIYKRVRDHKINKGAQHTD